MELVKSVANSMDEMITFTVDYPSNHKSQRLPVLDVKASVNELKGNCIEYEIFEKPTKNKKVIASDSALPAKQIRTILTQEGLRRLRNTSISLGKDAQTKYMNEYMIKLKNSGFKAKFRKEIVASSYNAFEKMLSDDKSGKKPLFRGKNWNKETRKVEKENKRKNWYKFKNKDGIVYSTVLFVPVTKGGKLAKELQRREEEINRFSKYRIKIIEDGGVKLKDMLIVKNPFQNNKCEEKSTCFLCKSEKSENPKIPCNSNNVGYQVNCDTCEARGQMKVYEGETGRSARLRGGEHLAGLRLKRRTNFLFKHKENDHKNEEMHISMKITKRYKDPLSRQANEAVRISNRNKNEILNSKSEFHHPPLTRITVERDNPVRNNGCDNITTKP